MISVVEKPEKQNDLVRVVTEMMQDGIIVTSDVELRQIVEAIVNRCRELNVAGATVFHAREGFGETAEIAPPAFIRKRSAHCDHYCRKPGKGRR